MKHTPKPWTAKPSIHGKKYKYVQIGKNESYGTLEVLPADAYLIAAAPDMLIALRDFLHAYGHDRQDLMDSAVKIARAAVAKATNVKLVE